MYNIQEFEEHLQLIELTIDDIGPWYYRPETNSSDPGWAWHCTARDWLFVFGPLLKTYITNPSVAVQAGGWNGLYPRLLAERFDLVYTFEPDPNNFYVLNKNCQKRNIVKFQAALCDTNSPSTLDLTQSTCQGRLHDSRSITATPVFESLPVQSLCIDSLNLNNCGLIMLDVEGFELQILQGARNTIKNYKPVIITEKHYSAEFANMQIEYLASLDYKLHIDLHEDFLFLPI